MFGNFEQHPTPPPRYFMCTLEINGKEFAKKMFDMGRGISKWWYTKPKKAVPGKGKLVQNPITGAWQQEYKPNRSMNMRKWLDAANQGKVMPHMNPKGQSLDREPTEEEKGISNEMKKKRQSKVWDWLLGETINIKYMWHHIYCYFSFHNKKYDSK